jgi:hypothetical protein
MAGSNRATTPIDAKKRRLIETSTHPLCAAASSYNCIARPQGHFDEEAGDSRIWAGIHYQMDNLAGAELGRSVAQVFIDWAEHDARTEAHSPAGAAVPETRTPASLRRVLDRTVQALLELRSPTSWCA